MCRKEAVSAFSEDNPNHQMDSTVSSSSSGTGNQKKSLPDQAINMLEMVRAATRNVPSVAGLFMVREYLDVFAMTFYMLMIILG